jgi:uncharacterized protein DUF6152
MMRMPFVQACFLGALGAALPAAHAHHSWSAEYDLSRSTVLSGTVARFEFRYPHSLVLIDVVNSDGKRERWSANWGSPQRLRDRGIDERWLRAGDDVYVVGNPHRDGDTRAVRVESLERVEEPPTPAPRTR